jgi:hypothetical protein
MVWKKDGYAQLFFRKTDPGGIVGVGVHQGADTACGQVGFQLVPQAVPPEIVNVKALTGQSQHLGLFLVHGESRVDEQDAVLTLDPAAGHHHGEKATLHGTHGGHAVGRLHMGVQESLHET